MAERWRSSSRRASPPPPRYNSLVASAAVLSQHPEGMRALGKTGDWQNEAWDFYDRVGELRFGVGWLANGMSRVNLVAALQPQQQGDEPSAIELPDVDELLVEPEPVEGEEPAPLLTEAQRQAVELVSAIAGGPDGQGQVLAQLAIQLSIPGIGYLLLEAEPIGEEEPPMTAPEVELPPAPDETWCWRVLAADELRAQGEMFEVAEGPSEWRPLREDHVLVKVWRGHPRRSWEPDSPCRAVLSVLQQITLLDSHVQATAQSRLAGAGLLVLPTEVEFAPVARAPGQPTPPEPDTGEPAEDDFSEVLTETMTIPIGDRGSAAAVVPLTIRVPGEYVDKVHYLTFWSDFSDNLLPLRESAVKRLALGLDMPPEVLMGMAGMNHWGAWQVEEIAITLHIEPMAETICHALTIGYLRPALIAAGVPEAEADELMVWYDTTDLTTRPDRSTDAMALYDRIELSGAAARREAGLSEDDAPDEDEKRMRILLDVAKGAPTLAPQMLAEAGLLGEDVAEAAQEAEAAPPGAEPQTAPSTTPTGEGVPAGPAEEPAAAAVVVEACDALVYRALERAGGRLRSAAGRKVNGGASAVDCPDPTMLHVTLGGATKYADLDALLSGSWQRVPAVAARLGLDAAALTDLLDSYTRALLATGHAHDSDRLADALGLHAAV